MELRKSYFTQTVDKITNGLLEEVVEVGTLTAVKMHLDQHLYRRYETNAGK